MAEPIDSLRLFLADPVVDYSDTSWGDGVRLVYFTSHKPILATPDVSVDGTPVTPTVTLATGKLDFATALADTKLVVVNYQATVFTDAQLQSFFDTSGGGVNLDLAAAAGWRAKAARYVEEVEFSADGLQVNNSTKYRAALQQAQAYEAKGKSPEAALIYSDAVPYVGGIDVDDKELEEDDTARVKPAFVRNMMRPFSNEGNTSEDVG